VSVANPTHFWRYLRKQLRLGRYLQQPGDGRVRPVIPARDLLRALLFGQLLRACSFHSIEALVRSAARRALGVTRRFGDDALAYFSERLDVSETRAALLSVLRQAKRGKAFDNAPLLGLALDGTSAGRCRKAGCALCRPLRNKAGEVLGYRHHLVMISIVGTGLSLPFDVEPYGPGEGELTAAKRLLQRVIEGLGRRFADYVVVDGEYAGAPFLHLAEQLGLGVIVRLKANLPTLLAEARQRLGYDPAPHVFGDGTDRVELWERDDFQPWDGLEWPRLRVLFYRQHKPDGQVIEAYWLTNLSCQRVSARSLYRLAKSRWEIENQGFNDAKNRYGFEHICRHHPNALLAIWLLTLLAITAERLYRLRYLRRGSHRLRSAAELCRLFWLSLSAPPPILDSS